MVSCSAIKVGVQKYEGGGIGSDGFCLPKKPLGVMSPAFLQVTEYLILTKLKFNVTLPNTPKDWKAWMASQEQKGCRGTMLVRFRCLRHYRAKLHQGFL